MTATTRVYTVSGSWQLREFICNTEKKKGFKKAYAHLSTGALVRASNCKSNNPVGLLGIFTLKWNPVRNRGDIKIWEQYRV